MVSTASAAVVGIMLTVSSVADVNSATWWTIDGMRSYIAEGVTIKSIVIGINMQLATVKMVSIPFEAKVAAESSEISLRSFAAILLKDPAYSTSEWLAVNAGFSSYAVDIPFGLLVSGGRVYSSIQREKNEGVSRGVLCQHGMDGQLDIVMATEYRPNMCWQAIQAGPVLVEPDGQVAIAPEEPKRRPPFRRTVICLVDEVKIKIVLTEQETNLRPLAVWLTTPESAGGLGCRSAMNLSGDASSGIAIKSSGQQDTRYFGEGSFPIPTALIFEVRK